MIPGERRQLQIIKAPGGTCEKGLLTQKKSICFLNIELDLSSY